jgi:hypothetical protein
MTSDARHSRQSPTNGGIHVVHSYEYVSTAARDAASYTAADIGKLARVGASNPYTFYLLTSHSPITWSSFAVPTTTYDDYDLLLEIDPVETCNYSVTQSGELVSKEEWKRLDTTLIKSIDYTYSGVNIATVVKKVFSTDGITVGAQLTITYSYVGNSVSSATIVRDI